MKCKPLGDIMMKYFDGNCSSIENEKLKKHLKICRECSNEFDSLSEIFGMLSNDGKLEPPEDFEIKVLDRIKQSGFTHKKKVDTYLTFLYSSAAIILVLVTMVIFSGIGNLNIVTVSEKLSMFSSGIASAYGTIRAFHDIFNIARYNVYHTAYSIAQTYYNFLLAAAAMFFIIQKTYPGFLRNNDSKTK